MGFSSAPRRTGLARTLSKLGYCSRSRAGELIRAGRVKVNGALRRNPESPVNVEEDRISVDDENVSASKKIYLILNKPRGIVTSASDEKGRKTVYAYLDADIPFVSPVGRLDKASEGLLLLTNDSEWGARLVDPETHLDKTYHVQIGALADQTLLQKLVAGVKVDGALLRAKRARLVRYGDRNCWLEVVLDEGKNRHIRRMMDALGIDVLRLVRVAIGPLVLGHLSKGAVRALTKQEKYALDKSLRQSVPRRSTARGSS